MKRLDATITPRGVGRSPLTSDVSTISTASKRLRALAELSGSLTDPLHPDEAAKLVEEEALSVLRASGAVVVTLGPFPYDKPHATPSEPPADARLHLVHAIGLLEEIQAALQECPLDAPVPFAEVARTGKPMFLESDEEMRRYDSWGKAMVEAGAHAAAIVPVWANGELRGVLGLSWPTPKEFDADERAFVLTLGVMCAQAILRSHLRAAETKARELAERADRSKANFLTMISHELRTPLTAVMGYSDLIAQGMDGPITAKQTDHFAKMQASSGHLLELIEELLGYARLEAGQDVVNAEPVLLVETIEDTLQLVRPLAEKRGLRIRVEVPDTPVELFTDQRKLRQILVNLLANAVKFSENGEVTLIVHVAGLAPVTKIVFEITDRGSGISLDAQAQVFDAFWQQNPQTGVRGGGTGLGLPIARQLARLLGGDVIIGNSTPGVGSTFIVTLPLRYEGTPSE